MKVRRSLTARVVVLIVVLGVFAPPAFGVARRGDRPSLAEAHRSLPDGVRDLGTATGCVAPNDWYPADWPEDSTAKGFRAWVCAGSPDAAEETQNQVLAIGASLWGPMTVAEPSGMGLPISDGSLDDNGKIDVYVLGAGQCRERGGNCYAIDEATESAAAISSSPCSASGSGVERCSGYLTLALGRLEDPAFTADFAHEFFHVLQFAHNASLGDHWYAEASASWAEWHYARTSAKADLYDLFRQFQTSDRSLISFDPSRKDAPQSPHQYQSWVWPLFQEGHEASGAPNVFQTWAAAESASSAAAMDAVVNDSLPFKSFYRDFAVRNVQPPLYRPPGSTGLEPNTWRSAADRADFPRTPHGLNASGITLQQGNAFKVKTRYRATVPALAAQTDEFVLSDPKARQITIDIASLDNVSSADLDVIGRQSPSGSGDPWSRIASTEHELTLCRDEPTEDFDRIYVVISNHAFDRDGDFADSKAAVKGSYAVTTKRSCDLVPTTFSGTATAVRVSQYVIDDVLLGVTTTTIEMSGTFTFDRKVYSGYEFTYDFDGDVTYRMSGYDVFCEEMRIDPTLVPGHGVIHVDPKKDHLEYSPWGGIVPTYDDAGRIIGPEVEYVEVCDGETNTRTTGVDTWEWLRPPYGHLKSHGLELKGSWIYEDYDGDPDGEMTFTWDFVGECPCPPTGTG